MNEQNNYSERYCAFVDILGFASLIQTLRAEDANFPTGLLATLHTPWKAQRTLKGADFRAQSISDAVAISTEVNAQGLRHMFVSLTRLSLDLLEMGYFVRGAVVKGPLYHDDNRVFGAALLKAINLEREIVRFPRIMISSDVAQDLRSRSASVDFGRFVLQADDGPYYLHVLRGLTTKVVEEENDAAVIQRLIQRRFDQAVDNPRHFEKVQWFARYWNRSLETLPIEGLGRIVGAGLERPEAHYG